MGPFPARRIECSKRGNGGAGMKGQAGEHLEGQLWAVGLVIVANLLTLAALLGKREEALFGRRVTCPAQVGAWFPRVSAGIFAATSLYFLSLAWEEHRSAGSAGLDLVLCANVLTAAAVGLKTRAVFAARPGSRTALLGAEED